MHQVVEVIGFGRRFVATCIDGVVVLFFSSIIALLTALFGIMFNLFQANTVAWNYLIMILMAVVAVLYYLGSWTRSGGQTLGKVWLKIQVVSAEGGPLPISKAILRFVGYLLSGIVASLGFFWVAIDKKRRGWHDMIAGTYVLSVRDILPKHGNIIFEPADEKSGWLWILLWLLLAVGFPGALFSGLWFLGPAINGFFINLFENLG